MNKPFSIISALFKAISFYLFAFLLFIGCTFHKNGKNSPPENSFKLVLLHTNDSHGAIFPINECGGLAQRASYINKVRNESEYVLLVDAGDINTGQAISNLFHAEPDILAYNYMKYDAVAVGNHEFDNSIDTLLKQIHTANFPFLTSNILYKERTLDKDYIIKEYNGVKVGLFGLTTSSTKEISVGVNDDLIFKDEIKTAQQMITLLKEKKVHIIIALTHLGLEENNNRFVTSQKLAQQTDGIDIIVDGHSHSYIKEPLLIKNTWIVSAGEQGKYVGNGLISIKDNHIQSFKWEPVPINTSHYQPDTALLNILHPYIEAAQQNLKMNIGHATALFPYNDKYEQQIPRIKESSIGNLITDAIMWETQRLSLLHVDFAFINGGSIRSAIRQGEISKEDIFTVLPFHNEIQIITMKGKEVKKLFQFIASIQPGDGAFPQVSKEIKLVINPSKNSLDTLLLRNKQIEDDTLYHIATTNYITSGKDGYKDVIPQNLTFPVSLRNLSDVVIDYITMKKEGITPETGNRIIIKK